MKVILEIQTDMTKSIILLSMVLFFPIFASAGPQALASGFEALGKLLFQICIYQVIWTLVTCLIGIIISERFESNQKLKIALEISSLSTTFAFLVSLIVGFVYNLGIFTILFILGSFSVLPTSLFGILFVPLVYRQLLAKRKI